MYKFAGKQQPVRILKFAPISEDEARAKFAYFRKAESQINGGPAPIYVEPKPPRKYKPRQRKIADCGTSPGYSRHIRLKEKSCTPCLVARREYQRAYKAKKRQERMDRRAMVAEITCPKNSISGTRQ